MQLLIRCDANATLGLGHVGRCLALAEELDEQLGITPVFIARADPVLARFLAPHSVEVRPLKGGGYALAEVLAALHEPAVLVSDSYDLDADTLSAVASTGARHVVIDDFARLTHWSGALVVNTNIGAEKLAYPGAAAVLAGPRYALLRREVRAVGASRRHHPSRGRRVLVCLGGGSWGAHGARLLSALATLAKDGVEVSAATEEATPRGIRRCPSTQLATLLRWADVAVLSGGVLKYEAAAASLPMLLVSVVAHQATVADAFARAGAAIYLGDATEIEPSMLLGEVRALLADACARRDLATRAHALVDGRGVVRVVEAILPSFQPLATMERPCTRHDH